MKTPDEIAAVLDSSGRRIPAAGEDLLIVDNDYKVNEWAKIISYQERDGQRWVTIQPMDLKWHDIKAQPKGHPVALRFAFRDDEAGVGLDDNDEFGEMGIMEIDMTPGYPARWCLIWPNFWLDDVIY